MTYETYENLKRVNSRRKRQATYTGNWKEVEECCNQDNRLDEEYARSIQLNEEYARSISLIPIIS